ncbi:MAG: hypothetical protein QOF71_1278 [Candidatus Eremiobacteraeota bacterium]|jgi:hypothetical protein|nr:hypothetical protein [Candidatus Eremiobacteraeota bacterium]
MLETIGRRAAISAGAIIAVFVLAHAAGAQTPKPSPSPMPTVVAFSAHAHANVTVVTQGNTFSGSLQLGVAQRTNLIRIDILSVQSDTIPIPPLTVTAVIDRGANTLTVWNDATKQYRMQPFLPRAAASAAPRPSPSPSPRPSASPRPGMFPRGRSPFADLDVLSLTLKMTGHTTTSGLPTTGLAFDLQVQRKADKMPSHVVATTQLADDFPVFPMTLDVSVEPGMAPVNAKLSYAVDDLTRTAPPLERFKVPAGYTEASSLLAVLFPGRFVPMPSPSPSPK